MAASCDRINKASNALWTAADVMKKALLFCQNSYFLDIIAESTFGEHLDLLNSNRVFSLKVARILEDMNFICEGFHVVSFVSVPLKYM